MKPYYEHLREENTELYLALRREAKLGSGSVSLDELIDVVKHIGHVIEALEKLNEEPK